MLSIGKPAPIVAEASVCVDQPNVVVFEFVGGNFLKNYPLWSPQVQEVTPATEGQFGLGSVARQITVDEGRRSEAEFTVVTYAPHKHFALRGNDEPFRCDYQFEPVPETAATRIVFRFELLEVALVMRPFQKLIKAAIEEGAEQTVSNIKRLLDTDIDRPAP